MFESTGAGDRIQFKRIATQSSDGVDLHSTFYVRPVFQEKISCPHCHARIATIHSGEVTVVDGGSLTEDGDSLQPLARRFYEAKWMTGGSHYEVSLHWGRCRSCSRRYWFLDALILPHDVPMDWWWDYLASDRAEQPASFYCVRYLGSKAGVPKRWSLYTQQTDQGRIDCHSFGPFSRIDEEMAADVFISMADTLKAFAGSPIETPRDEIVSILPSSRPSNLQLRRKNFDLSCPYCKAKVMGVGRHDSWTTQQQYWLYDGEMVGNLYDALSYEEKDEDNWDAEILVGRCVPCREDYFVFEAKFINAVPDEDWKERYFMGNKDPGVETNLVVEYHGVNPIIPKKWWLQCFDTPLGRMDTHIFGPFKTGFLNKRRVNDTFCPGSNGPENDRAFNVLINLWKEFRQLSESKLSFSSHSSNQTEDKP